MSWGRQSKPKDVRRSTLTRTIVIAAIAAVALLGGTWALAATFVSPQQLQAAASPPDPDPILAEVVRGDLDDSRLVSGAVDYVGARNSPLSPHPDAARTVVTSVALGKGDTLAPGSVVLTLNDQPVFAIDSPFAFYRDLGPGSTGLDVSSLQRTLVAAGLLNSADGVYGAITSKAVSQLFQTAGYSVPQRPVVNGESQTDADTETRDKVDPEEHTSKQETEPYLPLSAVLAIDALPAVIQSLPQVGQQIDTSTAVVVSDAAVVVRATAPSDVNIEQLAGVPVTGQIDGVGEFIGTISIAPKMILEQDDESSNEDEGFPEQDPLEDSSVSEIFAIPSEATPLTTELVGKSITLSIPLAQVARDELLVPSSAVSTEDAGKGAVMVQRDGSFIRVRIDIVGSLGGTIAIRAPEGGLDEGDKVLLG